MGPGVASAGVSLSPVEMKPAGQMSVCRTAVGLADRLGDGVIELRGRRASVQAVLRHVTGRRLVSGSAVQALGAWWCLVTPYRALVLFEEHCRDDVREAVRTATRDLPTASIIDLSVDYAAIAMCGPCGADLLADAGLPDVAPGRVQLRTGGRPAIVVRESEDRVLVLVPGAHHDLTWELLLEAGQAHGAAHVAPSTLALMAVGDRVIGCARDPRPAMASGAGASIPA